jgi:hypothetical protein
MRIFKLLLQKETGSFIEGVAPRKLMSLTNLLTWNYTIELGSGGFVFALEGGVLMMAKIK